MPSLRGSVVALTILAFVGTSLAYVAQRQVEPGLLCGCPVQSDNDFVAQTIFTDSYECRYPLGRCVWDSVSGELLTVDSAACRRSGTCPNGDLNECICEPDLTGAPGTLIGDIIAYQCNYTDGFCNYDSYGRLLNPDESSCVTPSSGCDIKTP